MSNNLLINGGFEADWGDEESHRCLVFPADAGPEEKDIGNIFTPYGWLTWFHHEPGTWDQPEVRDAWLQNDRHRVRGGNKGMLLFTSFRKHDAGFLQQVHTVSGEQLRLTAWAHAWSNGLEEFHHHDGRWSEGAGWDVVAWPASDNLPHDTGDPQLDAKPNFTFWVGIDPTGGRNPSAPSVVWSEGYHIYNGYCQKLSVEATAQGGVATVFLRSRTLWGFQHNDAYWDDAAMVIFGQAPIEPPPPPPADEARGQPREQYERTYVLLPPGADAAWPRAVVDGSWDKHRYTVGGSADDAGIGDLDERRVIAVNPEKWPTDLLAFFEEYYPGVDVMCAECESSAALALWLAAMQDAGPPAAGHWGSIGVHMPPVTSPPADRQWWLAEIQALGVTTVKLLDTGGQENLDWVEMLCEAGIRPIVRLYQSQQFPGRLSADLVARTSQLVAAGAFYVEIGNEPNLDCEWKGERAAEVDWHIGALVATVANNWFEDASAVIARGGQPAIYAMAPTDRNGTNQRYSSVMWLTRIADWLATHKRSQVRSWLANGQVWLAVHASPFSRDLDHDPGAIPDDMCMRGYEVAIQVIEGAFGVRPEVISTEGGVYSPGHMRFLGWNSYPGGRELTEANYRICTSEMYQWAAERGLVVCTWILTDEGVSDPRWAGNGWYFERAPRQVALGLKAALG